MHIVSHVQLLETEGYRRDPGSFVSLSSVIHLLNKEIYNRNTALVRLAVTYFIYNHISNLANKYYEIKNWSVVIKYPELSQS